MQGSPRSKRLDKNIYLEFEEGKDNRLAELGFQPGLISNVSRLE